MITEENNGIKSDTRPASHLLCQDNWKWDEKHRSHEVKLKGTNLQTALFHPDWSNGTAAVMGTRVLNGGRYYWELILSKRIFGTSMMFGIGTRKTSLHLQGFFNLLGWDENSWGLSHKGLLWHRREWFEYTNAFRENVTTTVGLYFDGLAGTLTYYKDGKCLGVAFRDLHLIKEPLYPIISSTAAMTEMILINTRRDFINLQDRCRAVIVRNLKRKQDLKELYLPRRIETYLAEALDERSGDFGQANDHFGYIKT
ncbi:SPRY domain-containing SOCS box protein 3 [Sitophilus oryzae]|uniref:SPRY domain-containing SOCS box protein 3 n=1 Tax=Sitophilus oryzae TaxID=7048 RepID=A0A6J2XSJ0_SITOR|nr:SPRY domain-containing SOCS box protein 3 [Sitophilus oryzae]